MRPVVYSASSVNAYLDCHLRWYRSYILNDEGEPTDKQEIGIAMHRAAEYMLRGQGPVGERTDIIPLVRLFQSQVLPTYGKPVLIEATFQIEVNGIPFSGIIDSVDRHGDNVVLRDLKVTGSRPKAGRYGFNMTGYYLGATTALDQPIHAMRLDYLVNTRTPYYWPEDLAVPDEDDIGNFAATLERVANGVERGNYEPTGLGTNVCSWCPFRSDCGPYIRFQEVIDRRSP